MDENGWDIQVYEEKRGFANFAEWAKNAMTLLLLLGFIGLAWILNNISNTQTNIQELQRSGRERGYQNRAVACEVVIVDDDRTFALSANCTEDEILKHYPPEVCEVLGNPALCGDEFVPSPYPDPPRAGT